MGGKCSQHGCGLNVPYEVALLTFKWRRGINICLINIYLIKQINNAVSRSRRSAQCKYMQSKIQISIQEICIYLIIYLFNIYFLLLTGPVPRGSSWKKISLFRRYVYLLVFAFAEKKVWYFNLFYWVQAMSLHLLLFWQLFKYFVIRFHWLCISVSPSCGWSRYWRCGRWSTVLHQDIFGQTQKGALDNVRVPLERSGVVPEKSAYPPHEGHWKS